MKSWADEAAHFNAAIEEEKREEPQEKQEPSFMELMRSMQEQRALRGMNRAQRRAHARAQRKKGR